MEFLGKAHISIECGTVEAVIHYTNNGDNPTDESTVYTESFDLYKNATLKAIGSKEGLNDSDIVTTEVTVKLPEPLLQVNTEYNYFKVHNASQYVSGYGEVIFRYTFDGSEPTEDSEIVVPSSNSYTYVTSNGILKIKAFSEGNVPSDSSHPIIFSGFKVATPVISIVEDNNG